jgi:lipid-A-disaccharide synthase
VAEPAAHGEHALRIFLIAGEASGDALGRALMAALRELSTQPLRFSGIGGPGMAGQGLESLFDYSELSVMGLVEILPHASRLLRRIRQVAAAIEADPPDVLVTIDSPGFVFRVVSRLQGRDYPRIHYVAPTVWAWKPGRVHKFRRHFDRLLALLPFEPPYFERVGLPCTFVGHPVVEAAIDQAASRRRIGEAYAIPDEAALLCVLPGSRAGELDRHLPAFRDTVALLAAQWPGLRVVLPTLPHLQARLDAQTADWPVPVVVIAEAAARADAMAAADAALAASGTVTLELARARVPTVVAYRVAPLTGWLLRRLVQVEYVSIVNLIADRAVIPEFLQDAMRPADMAAALQTLLSDSPARASTRQGQAEAMRALGEGGKPPSRRAAAAVLDVVRDWRKTGPPRNGETTP